MNQRSKETDSSRIPNGWRLVRLDEVAQVNPRRPRLSLDPETLVTFLPMGVVSEDCSGIVTRLQRPYREVSKGYTYFQKNDILFAKITPCLQNGKHTLATGLNNDFGFGTTEFHVLRARARIDPRHLFRVVTHPTNIKRFANSFTGTAGQQRIQPEFLRSLRFHLPSLHEQQAIADVLDAIDSAIERTDAVIAATELLREALLHELLRKGLPGWHTEWQEHSKLGSLPADWRIVCLGQIASIRKQQVKPDAHDETPYVGLEHIRSRGSLLGHGRAGDTQSAKTMFKAGDTLFGKLRPNLRKVARAGFDGVCSTDILALVPSQGVNGRYLLGLMSSERIHRLAVRSCAGTRMPRTSWSFLRGVKIAIPGIREQVQVAEVLDGVDNAIEQTGQEKVTLEVFKESISDALLTGRVRVPMRT